MSTFSLPMLRAAFFATFLARALAGSAVAQAPDASCALPSEPEGIPATLDAAISGPADRDRAAMNRAAWAATLSRAWSPHIFFFAGDLRDGGKLYARMWAPALGIEEDPATGSACAALVGVMASNHDCGGTAYRLSIQQGVSMGRRSDIEAEARKRGSVVTSVSVGGAAAHIASGDIALPQSALVP